MPAEGQKFSENRHFLPTGEQKFPRNDHFYASQRRRISRERPFLCQPKDGNSQEIANFMPAEGQKFREKDHFLPTEGQEFPENGQFHASRKTKKMNPATIFLRLAGKSRPIFLPQKIENPKKISEKLKTELHVHNQNRDFSMQQGK